MPEASRSLLSDKEALILDAAQRRFAVYGLNKVTMDEIASDLGMGKASLYYYFPTKEELFRGVIEREQQEFLRRLQEITASGLPASDQLRRYVERRAAYFAELMNLQLLSIHPWLSSRPLFRSLFESFAAHEQKLLTDILRGGKKTGEFDVRSPEATAELILHVLQGLRLRAAQAAQPAPRPAEISEDVAREMKHLVELLVKGLAKTSTHRV